MTTVWDEAGLILTPRRDFRWRLFCSLCRFPSKLWENSTSSPGRFSRALEVGREKALASASHMTTKHPEFVVY